MNDKSFDELLVDVCELAGGLNISKGIEETSVSIRRKKTTV